MKNTASLSTRDGVGVDIIEAPSSARLVNKPLFFAALLLSLFDGADLAAMGVAMSRIMRELGLTAMQGSVAASASLLGLFVGAIACGRLADAIGRRIMLSVTASWLAVFSLLTAHATGFESLVSLRFLAGIGMGGLYPLVLTVAHETATPNFRARAVSLLVAAAGAGSLLVSFVASASDWRWIFYFGGGGPLVLIPFLLLIRDTESATREVHSADRNVLGILFGSKRIGGTLLVWVAAFFTSLTIFCVVNWVSGLLVAQGFSEGASHTGSSVYSVGAILGNLCSGFLVDRNRRQQVALSAFLAACASFIVLAFAPFPAVTFIAIFCIALSISGGQLVFYSATPSFYPRAGRGTGVGAMVGAGRLGSICGPLVAGFLLQQGASPSSVFLALIPAVLAALCFTLLFLRKLETNPSLNRETGSR
jgi:MFS transporter, AAHS family, 3-hydroxyphenylpropionic acid transporter